MHRVELKGASNFLKPKTNPHWFLMHRVELKGVY